MNNTRKRYTSEFKTKVVLEVISNTATLAEIASKYSLHPTMLSSWKVDFIEKPRMYLPILGRRMIASGKKKKLSTKHIDK